MILSILTDTCDIYSYPDQVSTVDLELFSPRVIQVNYDFECTPLFRAIQRKDWEKAAEIATENPEQVRTWVLRYHDGGDGQRVLRWKMLPIHALFLFSGTHGLAVLFLFIYPESVRLTDDQDMMPLHLACRNGALIETFEELLTAYPQALQHKDYKGRTPHDLVMISTHHQKEELLSLFVSFGGLSSSSYSQVVHHTKRNQKSSSPDSKIKFSIGNEKLLGDGRDMPRGNAEHRHIKDSLTPKNITKNKSKHFVQFNIIDAQNARNSNQSSSGSGTVVEESQVRQDETGCNGKVDSRSHISIQSSVVDKSQFSEEEFWCDSKMHGQSQILHDKTMKSQLASPGRSVTIDPVGTTHFFSESLKKAPKSPRVRKIALEKRKGSIKGQIIESKTQQNQQQTLQLSTNDLDHSVQLLPAIPKEKTEPNRQSTSVSNMSPAFSNLLAETSASAALSKTSLSSPDASKAATSPENPTPKLKGCETLLSFSSNVLDKIKPRLQTVGEHTRTEAKMLIQTMRDKRIQLLGKSCSDINDHRILENTDSAEAELKGSSDQNASLVRANSSKAANNTQLHPTKEVAHDESKDDLVHEVKISCDEAETSTNEQSVQLLCEVKKESNTCEVNDLQAEKAITAMSSSFFVPNIEGEESMKSAQCIEEESSALLTLSDQADLGNGMQRSVKASKDETLASDFNTTITTAEFSILPLCSIEERLDFESPVADTEHINDSKEEVKDETIITAEEKHTPIDSNNAYVPQEGNIDFQPQERTAPLYSIEERLDFETSVADTEYINDSKEEVKDETTATAEEKHMPIDSNNAYVPQEGNIDFQSQERTVEPVVSVDFIDSCSPVKSISALTFVREMISEHNENLKTSDLEKVTCLNETSSKGIHRFEGENHDTKGSECIGCLSEEENNDEGKCETEGGNISAAPTTNLSDKESISYHGCADESNEGAAKTEDVAMFVSDKSKLNSNSHVDEMTLHVAAVHSNQMEIISEVTIKLKGSSAYRENVHIKINEVNSSSEVCNQTDNNISGRENYQDLFIGQTEVERCCSVDYGQDVDNAKELYISSQMASLDQEVNRIEPEAVQSDETSNNIYSGVLSNISSRNPLCDDTQHQNGDIINELELTPTDEIKDQEFSRKNWEEDNVKESNTEACFAEGIREDVTDALENSSSAILSCEYERDSLKTSEQMVGDTNQPHESGPKRLNSCLPLRGKVESNSEPLAAVIEYDDEDVHFIDLTLNVIDLVDDIAPGTICLSALKFLEEKKQKMSLKIASENKDYVMATNKRSSEAPKKIVESVKEKKNNIPSYVRLHYDAMELVLKSERRDDDVSPTSNKTSQEDGEVSCVHGGENREDQLTVNKAAAVSKFSTTKFHSNNAIPSYVRLRSPSSTNSFGHSSNLLSPRNSNEISLLRKNYKVEKNVDVKERAKEKPQEHVTKNSTHAVIKKHQWQSKLEALGTTASNVQLQGPNGSSGYIKPNLFPGNSFVSEQKQLGNSSEGVKRPSMRLRSSWLSPSN